MILDSGIVISMLRRTSLRKFQVFGEMNVLLTQIHSEDQCQCTYYLSLTYFCNQGLEHHSTYIQPSSSIRALTHPPLRRSTLHSANSNKCFWGPAFSDSSCCDIGDEVRLHNRTRLLDLGDIKKNQSHSRTLINTAGGDRGTW